VDDFQNVMAGPIYLVP